MSADGRVTLTWGDGEHVFRLAIGHLRELQDKTGTGPFAILKRLLDGSWRVDDAREIIRLGLIGGGMTPIDALLLVKRYVDERPIMESIAPAQIVLGRALMGDTDDDVGKEQAGDGSKTTTASSSAAFTETLPPSAGPRKKPTNKASGN